MLLGQLGQVKAKQYLFMLSAKKNFGKLTMVKKRLEHRVFVLILFLLLLLFRHVIKGWINRVKMDYANLINFV